MMSEVDKKWLWMMDYCKNRGIPPAETWAWEDAKEAFDKKQLSTSTRSTKHEKD